MKLQFFRLFFLILVSLFLIGYITEKFINSNEENNPTITIETLKNIIEVNAHHDIELSKTRFTSIKKLAWPSKLTDKLINGEVISLSNVNQEVFYYWLIRDQTEQVVEFGPFTIDHDDNIIYIYISVAFYGLFALFLLLWLWPIFKDLIELINLTNDFSTNRKKIKTSVKPTSIISPLASSFENMSRQIVRFLSLQRFLASSISHDIRTPIARINFLLAMTTYENLEKSKNKIDKELDEIDSLTDDFIELARIEECHHQLNIVSKNILHWLNKLIKRVQITTHVSIELRSKAHELINHDEKFLQRAIQNLLINAIKYADDKVILTINSDIEQLEIRVEDDGMGIKPEEQERLTGLYERGKPSKKVTSGYGIGLAFVNIIAEWHGGNVEINRSKQLNGASISIFLPKNFSE